MHLLGQGLANEAGCFGSIDVSPDRDCFGTHLQLIKAHTGKFKQKREGYHDFLLQSDIEQMFTFSISHLHQAAFGITAFKRYPNLSVESITFFNKLVYIMISRSLSIVITTNVMLYCQ